MRIRLATDADVVAILRLWRGGTSVVSHTDDPQGLRGLLARDPEALLLAEDDGRLVGTLIAGWTAGGRGSTGWSWRRAIAAGAPRPRWSGTPKSGCAAWAPGGSPPASSWNTITPAES